jgi:hypothetical protein
MHSVSAHQHVNASGFPLQLAIGNAVRGGSAPGWSVLYEEHAWVLGEENGFIDLVLEDQNKTWLMNVECKRVRDSEWIFLHPIGQSKTRRHAKLWVTHRSGTQRFFDWTNVPMDPSSVESKYCVVGGQDPKSRPMLERVAASVVLSTEALATKELELVSEHYSLLRIYQNVVVTTATLKVCEVDISTIDIASGEIDAGSKFVDVPYVRFRKQLRAHTTNVAPLSDPPGLGKLAEESESTVFVVNSAHFVEFVNSCALPDNFERFCRPSR